MNKMNNSKKYSLLEDCYDAFIGILAILSAGIVILSFFTTSINLTTSPWNPLLNVFLIIFVIDYFARLAIAKNKRQFLLSTMFDLLSLVPLHPVFAVFRITRIVRIIRKHHLLWVLGLDGKFSKTLHRFIYNSGFLSLFTASVTVVVLTALLYSIVENISLPNAIWWAITTASTVGYGDISPKTNIGKVIASFLMIGGVGFIGLLTSTIVGFFTSESSDLQEADINTLIKKIDMLNNKVDRLQERLNKREKRRKR